MDTPDGFWLALDRLIATSPLRLDRPRGSHHPRYPDLVYPLDYGYLEHTQAMDGGGIDVWVGSLPERALTAIMCTVDLLKRDTEVKLLLGCTEQEQQTILRVHTTQFQAAMLCPRPPAVRTEKTGVSISDS